MKWLHRVAEMSSTSKGAKWVISIWLVLAIVMSMVAPSAKEWSVSEGTGLNDDALSMQAQQLLDRQFPTNDGLSALLVFQDQAGLKQADWESIFTVSRWLASSDKPGEVLGAVPLHEMTEPSMSSLIDEHKTTLMLPVRLEKGLENDQVRDVVEAIRVHVEAGLNSELTFAITGPAGIAADSLSVFRNADFVLMTATVVLILVMLLIMYRSFVLAVIPLLVSGLLYTITNHLLGLIGKNGWAEVETQALSIMMILLFAVLTDYCMFVFSRYREELLQTESQYAAMQKAISRVAEPVFFSAGTILLAVATLFVAVYEPYRNFAPVFMTAMAVILLGGVTLIPAIFALLGRRAFWPYIPKIGGKAERPSRLWERVARLVTTRPKRTFFLLLTAFLLLIPVTFQIDYSFNLMKSFPEATSSRQGFEMLETSFPKGELAPVTVLLQSEQDLSADDFQQRLVALATALQNEEGVYSVAAPANSAQLSEDKHTARWRMVLTDNPYDVEALDALQQLRDRQKTLLEASGLNPQTNELLFSGQTPIQSDVRELNGRDTFWVIAVVIVLIAVLLTVATRSLIAPLYMLGTILLTYGATLGITWLLFHHVLGYEAISYRIPLYAFVFIVALGVDYNLMLFARIREEAQRATVAEAIRRGVSKTGKVITSAGLILVATFSVLITQPLLELKAFGAVVAIGILLDTFLVRGLLMPSLMMMLGQWNWWPSKMQKEKGR
ncbi:hypothetical protein CIG75_02980 [Tumebacillus algifaecis]|uniref:SSD domain-containing protein n=1 Tax=Tumebacillus algifaecis TaxID=1214604 RepID=A0A223CXM8_9BACL|nr:MMPL family transporter [Tumebacillus algifaecis]ASS74046.1 hypothetical protein CIG75_02980 [Tumebacillus algifaecis]